MLIVYSMLSSFAVDSVLNICDDILQFFLHFRQYYCFLRPTCYEIFYFLSILILLSDEINMFNATCVRARLF